MCRFRDVADAAHREAAHDSRLRTGPRMAQPQRLRLEGWAEEVRVGDTHERHPECAAGGGLHKRT